MATVTKGLSNTSYHANPALGSSSIKTLATRTPAHYLYESHNQTHSTTFDIGTAAHSLILENDTSKFEVIDAPNWLSKAAKEARQAAYAEGLVPLLTKEFEAVKAMRSSVMTHPLARNAFIGHEPEVSIFWEHETGTRLKCRPDALHVGGKRGNLIVDLKTTVSAAPDDFASSAARYGYHLQQAHYTAGVKAAYGEDFTFLFVTVEKEPPYLPNVHQIHSTDVARGAELVERGIRVYNECTKTGVWPGYLIGKPLELPRWSFYKEEELLER
ncbi:hypothetical protein GCM10009861_02290 [Neomicrococcus aestuarii]